MSAETPSVTVVIAPRERFSCTQAALESVYQNTSQPFDLVYVDGGSPPHVRDYLREQAQVRGFQLIRREEHLSPNQARNLGMAQARGAYVAFMDNDVVVAPGWLEALVGCAETTGASVVGPLYFIGEPERQIIHLAGGDLPTETRGGQRWMSEIHRLMNRHYPEVREQIRRSAVDVVEFHCLMVRSEMLKKLGPFDEELPSLMEHLDLCMQVREAGGQIWLEPAAQVSYLAMREFELSDLAYFRLRWGEAWNRRSLDHFSRKWNLAPDCPVVLQQEDFIRTHPRHLGLPSALPVAADFRCAQTNVQLYRQCIALGYTPEDLALVRKSYEQAQRWFGLHYRASGRPMLAHLVGTASILAAHGAAPWLVAAGLVHSIYTYLSAQAPITAQQRESVVAAVGKRCEKVLMTFGRINWTDHQLDAGGRLQVERMGLDTANALLLRMASDLEERLERCTEFSAKQPDTVLRWLAAFHVVAAHMGLPQLAAALERELQTAEIQDVPAELISAQARSYLIKR